MAGLHSNRGAKRAREARADLGLDPTAPLGCVLTTVEEQAGVPVVVRAMPPDVAGCYWHEGDRRLIHVNGRHGLPRQRFTLAHELGHVRCGHDHADLVVDYVQTFSGTHDPLEIEANAFAAEFLVPRRAVPDLLDGPPTLDAVVVAAARYGVSAIVVLLRLTTCSAIPERLAARLRREIDEGAHLERFDELSPPCVEDRLAAIDELPYLAPALAGSALAAATSGAATMEQAARASGVSGRALATALEASVGDRGP